MPYNYHYALGSVPLQLELAQQLPSLEEDVLHSIAVLIFYIL